MLKINIKRKSVNQFDDSNKTQPTEINEQRWSCITVVHKLMNNM